MSYTYKQGVDLLPDKHLSLQHCVDVDRDVFLSYQYEGREGEGIKDFFASELKLYSKSLKGVVITFGKIRVLNDSIPVIDTQPGFNLRCKANYIVFRPTIGSILKGIVNKKESNLIGCLVLGIFNASIPKKQISSDKGTQKKWLGDDLELGKVVYFRVLKTNIHNSILSITGDFCDTSVAMNKKTTTLNETMGTSLEVSQLGDLLKKEKKMKKKKKKEKEKCDSSVISNLDTSLGEVFKTSSDNQPCNVGVVSETQSKQENNPSADSESVVKEGEASNEIEKTGDKPKKEKHKKKKEKEKCDSSVNNDFDSSLGDLFDTSIKGQSCTEGVVRKTPSKREGNLSTDSESVVKEEEASNEIGEKGDKPRKEKHKKKKKHKKEKKAEKSPVKNVVHENVKMRIDSDIEESVLEKHKEKTAEKSPLKSVGRSPVKSGEKSPVKSKGKSLVKSVEKTSVKIVDKSPMKIGAKSPVISSEESPVKCAEKSPVKSVLPEDMESMIDADIEQMMMKVEGPRDKKKKKEKKKRKREYLDDSVSASPKPKKRKTK